MEEKQIASAFKGVEEDEEKDEGKDEEEIWMQEETIATQ